MSKYDFEKLLLEAVDESLSSLGDSSKQAIYYHLDQTFDIKKREIPYKVDAFSNALKRIFGVGANFIETLIVKKLDEKVEGRPKWHVSAQLSLNDYVTTVKQSLLDNKTHAKVGIVQCEQTTAEA